MNVTSFLLYLTDTLYVSIPGSNAGDRSTVSNAVSAESWTLKLSPLRVASADSWVESLSTAGTPLAPVVKSTTSLPASSSRAFVPAADRS